MPNNTLTSGYASHIGQLFWDQDLITKVEATSPYNTNTVAITKNADDRVIRDEVSNTDSDPFLSYVYLGEDVSDGLFGWVTIGINTSASYSPNYSFEYTEEGGETADSGSTGTNGGGGVMPGSMVPGGVNGTFSNATASATGSTASATGITTSTTVTASSGSISTTSATSGTVSSSSSSS